MDAWITLSSCKQTASSDKLLFPSCRLNLSKLTSNSVYMPSEWQDLAVRAMMCSLEVEIENTRRKGERFVLLTSTYHCLEVIASQVADLQQIEGMGNTLPSVAPIFRSAASSILEVIRNSQKHSGDLHTEFLRFFEGIQDEYFAYSAWPDINVQLESHEQVLPRSASLPHLALGGVLHCLVSIQRSLRCNLDK